LFVLFNTFDVRQFNEFHLAFALSSKIHLDDTRGLVPELDAAVAYLYLGRSESPPTDNRLPSSRHSPLSCHRRPSCPSASKAEKTLSSWPTYRHERCTDPPASLTHPGSAASCRASDTRCSAPSNDTADDTRSNPASNENRD